ncbi:MAG: hypothetical protein IJ211_00225 [Campylobacter sp.]|nr:hypothetical protein [Campylobacter sp.]
MINFQKISNSPIEFNIESDGVKFSGNLTKKSLNLVSCKGKMQGVIPYICDRCGNDFELEIDEEIDLLLSDGIFKDENQANLDIMEFFNGQIDLDEILQSELEAYKSDYLYCMACKNYKENL